MFFLALCCLMPVAHGRKVYMVSAGVSDYPGTANDLTLPAMDARAMNRLYRTNSSAETILLTNDRATIANIVQALRQQFRKARKDDIVVFFFSGHGYPGGFVAYDLGKTRSHMRIFDIRTVSSRFVWSVVLEVGRIRIRIAS